MLSLLYQSLSDIANLIRDEFHQTQIVIGDERGLVLHYREMTLQLCIRDRLHNYCDGERVKGIGWKMIVVLKKPDAMVTRRFRALEGEEKRTSYNSKCTL